MHQVTVLLIAILAIISVAIAEPLLPDGYYRICKGKHRLPRTYRYFTAYPNANVGSVRLEPRDEAKLQVWRLRNHGKGRVSLEVYDKNADKRKFLSEGRPGILPGAHLGVIEKRRKWFFTSVGENIWTRYILTHPIKYYNQTLVASEGNSRDEDINKPNWVTFRGEDQEDYTREWRFLKAVIDDDEDDKHNDDEVDKHNDDEDDE
ncbi:hypothetical protein BCR41DRAFT_421745 [Lobosporangium transversale]|uniref:Uncharacterized protein n=1 Tax=Lobosporangium transversale TaxID=64571 RepID=A0A1Y2GPF2_9FUNG|nr:hypothetical protein BCR41DRAFT_421745 [Lobosporangium transversale]ORZ17527.1 hypothetical protein BCR41DRAFT_421745 [Lobosporangium transversale]|eukprot:XP_021881914.1 hypothetical protein BCR41DRAFT_421745 [Lobosporangium transversale]